jgi:hypothetical protein
VPTFADRGCHVVSVTDPSGYTVELQQYYMLPYYITAYFQEQKHACTKKINFTIYHNSFVAIKANAKK